MLVLSRKAGQEIMIGDHIIVTIIKTTAGKIKIGITAPKNVPVIRLDHVQAKKEENGVL